MVPLKTDPALTGERVAPPVNRAEPGLRAERLPQPLDLPAAPQQYRTQITAVEKAALPAGGGEVSQSFAGRNTAQPEALPRAYAERAASPDTTNPSTAAPAEPHQPDAGQHSASKQQQSSSRQPPSMKTRVDEPVAFARPPWQRGERPERPPPTARSARDRVDVHVGHISVEVHQPQAAAPSPPATPAGHAARAADPPRGLNLSRLYLRGT